jgi:hypothetical protein
MPVVGFLDPASPETIGDRLRGFRQGLKDSGYVEGENVTIVYRWADGQYDRLPELGRRAGSPTSRGDRRDRYRFGVAGPAHSGRSSV